jgi:acyl carrier protein
MKKEKQIMNDAISSELSQYILTNILKQPNRKLDQNEPLISSGLIDSFSLVDLALFVEDTYNVKIADTELNAQTFDNLSDLCKLIIERKP